ncbi:MAG TPA: hypothetical protein DG752_00145, partial [Leeuwenhoekiella sp.]|nr:hypothetical protein [Leeuwenhoekiella sp.]
AFATLPEAAQDESTEKIIKNFKIRRDNLMPIARRYYEYLMRHQILLGTGDKDDFIITRLPNGKTRVALTTEDDRTFER